MDNKYNTYYIVSLINNEIEIYENNIKKINETKTDIKICEDMINLLESNNYGLIRSNMLLFDTFLPVFLNIIDPKNNKLLKRFEEAVFCCTLFEKKPERYDETIKLKCAHELKKMCSYLKEVYTKKIIELNNYNQRITLDELIELKRIRNSFKFKKNITSHHYILLIKLFDFNNINDVELIRFLEVIKTYNTKTHAKNKNIKIDYSKLNGVTNLINSGFEYIEIPYIEDKSMKTQLDNLVNSIIQVANTSFEDSILMLPNYSGEFTFGDSLSIDDFKYLINSLLKYYQNIHLDLIQEITKLENYEDKGYRNLIVEEYKKIVYRYNFLREYYFKELNKFQIDQENLSQVEDVNIVNYAIGSESSNKCLFERDLGDISSDRYGDIENLINRFKKGKLKQSESKSLHHAFDELLELRGDQIRILYKHLKGNEYVILGCFLKKTDNDINQYKRFNDRINNAFISAEEAEVSIKELYETKHKGGRSNS